MAQSLQLRALRKAARILGGEDRLRDMLDAPPAAFARWMQGAEALPTPIFLMLVDFLADMESGIAFILPSDDGGKRRDPEVAN